MEKKDSYRPSRKWVVRSSTGLATLVLSTAAYSAAPASWWVDIANDRGDAVKTLLAQGADPNEVNKDGQPALMQAIRDGAWDVYDILLAHRKIDVNATNATGETPLMYLAVVGDTKRAQALIKRGAQVNRLGWTPLQYAASTGKLETVKMLIANKAMIDAPSPDGTTALMMAALAGSEPVVRLLLQSGAEVTTQNLKKQDAADWARLKNHTVLAKQLDQLIQEKLDERAALRAGQAPGSAESAPATPDPGTEPSRPSSDKVVKEPDAGGGTSRYFDLDRFNDDVKN